MKRPYSQWTSFTRIDYVAMIDWRVSLAVKLPSDSMQRRNQFDNNEICSVLFSTPVAIIYNAFAVFSRVTPTSSIHVEDDHLILLDFVGYFLCKLIVHHCLLWWMEDGMESGSAVCVGCPALRRRRKDFLLWWEDYLSWKKAAAEGQRQRIGQIRRYWQFSFLRCFFIPSKISHWWIKKGLEIISI
jgi:hypothetical protein